MTSRIACAFLILLLVSAVHGQQQGNLTVKVGDVGGGTGISGSRVIIRWEDLDTRPLQNIGIRGDMTGTTDSKGLATFSLPEGFYDVMVSDGARSPSCAKIQVGPDPMVKEFRTRLSPLLLTTGAVQVFAVSPPRPAAVSEELAGRLKRSELVLFWLEYASKRSDEFFEQWIDEIPYAPKDTLIRMVFDLGPEASGEFMKRFEVRVK